MKSEVSKLYFENLGKVQLDLSSGVGSTDSVPMKWFEILEIKPSTKNFLKFGMDLYTSNSLNLSHYDRFPGTGFFFHIFSNFKISIPGNQVIN